MTTATARLDLRLEWRDKDRIARAAALRGMPVSSFVRDVVLREAGAPIAADTVVTLSHAEARRYPGRAVPPLKRALISQKLWEELEPVVSTTKPSPKAGRPRLGDRVAFNGICSF